MQLATPGSRVLVTAAGGGIGRVIAQTFHNAGARVYICDVVGSVVDSAVQAMPGSAGCVADVADDDAVGRLFDLAIAHLGGLDVLVNNAGIAGPTARIEDIAPADWERTLAVNITGMFYCARRAVPLLKVQGGGSIINMSSAAGRLGFPLRTPYSASKYAIIGFTESLAMECGPDAIRVNAILPGVVEGPRIDHVISAKAQAYGISFEQQRDNQLSKVSLRTMVSPQDIANMALFLASDLGRHVSGQSLSVCGNVETLG